MKNVSSSRRLTCASSRWRTKIQTVLKVWNVSDATNSLQNTDKPRCEMCEAGSPPQPPSSPDKDIQLSVFLTFFAVHRLRQSQLVQPKHRSYCLSTLWSKCASLKTKRFHLKPTSVKKQNKRNITLLGEQSAGGNTRTSIQPEKMLHYWSTMRPITTVVCLLLFKWV